MILAAFHRSIVTRIHITAPVSHVAGPLPQRAARYAHSEHVTLVKAAQLHGCSVEAARIAYAEMFPDRKRIAV
jgi:ABC-type enterobactin transport system permease subunit